jgi:glutamate racemase
MQEDYGIGVFDSGVGGLSVAKEIRLLMPDEDIVYFADTLHMPYGSKPLEDVRRFALEIAGAMRRLPVKAVVVACNTASAAALADMRREYPDGLFVGMVPAVKPAARQSGTRRVGVLATRATFQGELFASVVDEFAGDAEVVCQPCPGLAEFIESHAPDDPALMPMLEKFIAPLRERNVDQLVLGCTHYALVKDAIARVAGEGVAVVDPAPAIARRVRAVLGERGLLRAAGSGGGKIRYAASGDADAFLRAAAAHMDGEGDAFPEILSEMLKDIPLFGKVEGKKTVF